MKTTTLKITEREAKILFRAILEEKRFLRELPKQDDSVKLELKLIDALYEKLRFTKRGVK